MKNLFIAAVLILAIASTGCANKYTKVTNRVNASNISDQTYINKHFSLIEKDVEIGFKRHFLLYIPITGYYSFDEAAIVDELLFKYNGDLVTDLVIKKKVLILLYYNSYYVSAKGNVWKRKKETL